MEALKAACIPSEGVGSKELLYFVGMSYDGHRVIGAVAPVFLGANV